MKSVSSGGHPQKSLSEQQAQDLVDRLRVNEIQCVMTCLD